MRVEIEFKEKIVFFGIIKDNNNLCWEYGYEKERISYTCTKQINPFPRWKKRIEWYYDYLSMYFSKTLYKKCQGCGEGVALWRIRDPNQGKGNTRFNCCNSCVSFYDWRFSLRKIVSWKKVKTKMIKTMTVSASQGEPMKEDKEYIYKYTPILKRMIK